MARGPTSTPSRPTSMLAGNAAANRHSSAAAPDTRHRPPATVLSAPMAEVVVSAPFTAGAPDHAGRAHRRPRRLPSPASAGVDVVEQPLGIGQVVVLAQ